MNFKLVRVGAEKSFWESEWGTCVSGLVEGLCVTRVISMVTDQHGSSDSFKPRASGSHEKGDSHSKRRGRRTRPCFAELWPWSVIPYNGHMSCWTNSVPLSKPKVFREHIVLSGIFAHLMQGLNSFVGEWEGNVESESADTGGGGGGKYLTGSCCSDPEIPSNS